MRISELSDHGSRSGFHPPYRHSRTFPTLQGSPGSTLGNPGRR
ncbi:MAG: hypothetical protein M0Z25_00120 [Nitrospiraceae bacterium]|nr:hypothetical protein [Nitrospiraceae bacterium]